MIESDEQLNIFFSVNNNYIEPLLVAMVSLLETNNNSYINFTVLSSDFSDYSKGKIEKLKIAYGHFTVNYIKVARYRFDELKLNIDYITLETYYRYLIAELCPEIDKALYLDADLVCTGDLRKLWETDIEKYYCAGVKDLYIEQIAHKQNIGLQDSELYINAGVILFNLKKIREDNLVEVFFENNKKLLDVIKFQDQDIINVTLQGKIKELDSVYNFTSSNLVKEKSKQKDAIIIHYTGARKPWHWDYADSRKSLWLKYAKLNKIIQERQIKAALLIDEFPDAPSTAQAGFTPSLINYIINYLPNEDVKIDVLMGQSQKKGHKYIREKNVVGHATLYSLPQNKFFAGQWLRRKKYDVYLSTKLTDDYVLRCESDTAKKLILWVNDTRTEYALDQINTVQLSAESVGCNQRTYTLIHEWNRQERVKFISQGYSLKQKASDLYNLPINTPIEYLPEPVAIDKNFVIQTWLKKNSILFFGSIELVKGYRLFCEIAKRMPQYDFFVLGQVFRDKEKNLKSMPQYQESNNLHFVGWVEEEEKKRFLKDAKILVDTSTQEAIPRSFLEALSYGTLIVSARNPANMPEWFGRWVEDVFADGFDKVALFVHAIEELLSNEELRQKKSVAARQYIEQSYNVERFSQNLRKIIFNATAKDTIKSV